MLTKPGDRAMEDRKSLLELAGGGWEATAMTVEGNSVLVRLFNAAGDERPRRLCLDGRVGKASLIELNGDLRERLHPTVEPDGRTMVSFTIPRFGFRTLKIDDYQPVRP